MSEHFTNIKVFKARPGAPASVKGNGTVVVGGVMEVNFTIFQGKNGLYVSLPAKKGNKEDPETGKVPWYPEVKIPDDEVRETFQQEVLAAFEQLTSSAPKRERTKTGGGGSNLPF